jgi:DNA mismatch repair ATPase MutL
MQPEHKSSVNRLNSAVAAMIQSSSALGTVNLIVKELATNSLEASASSIDIFVDKSKFLVMVKDNGHGISEQDLQTNICKWGYSSKGKDNKRQCLAALLTLVDSLEIVSKTCENPFVYSKRITLKQQNDDSIPLSIDPSLQAVISHQGTIVIAYNIFATLPVRQRSIRWDHELALIKDWVMRMSLLHHSINWTVTELSQSRELCRINSTLSVVQSLIANFGSGITNKVCHVDISHKGYRLAGLISVPKHDCCVTHKDLQMLFVHGRLMQKCEIISTILNKVYSRFLATQNRSGFNARHMDLQAESYMKYPFYVLQISCPTAADYDVLVDPNKSMVYFRQPEVIEQLIKLLLQYLQRSSPELQSTIDSVLQRSNGSENVGSVSSVIETSQQSPALKKHAQAQALLKATNYSSQSHKSIDETFGDAFGLTEIAGASLTRPTSVSSRTSTWFGKSPSANATPSKPQSNADDIFGLGVTVERVRSSVSSEILPLASEINHDSINIITVDNLELSRKEPSPTKIVVDVSMNQLGDQRVQSTLDEEIGLDEEPTELTIGEYLVQSESRSGQFLHHRQVALDPNTAMSNVYHVEHNLDRLQKKDPRRRKRSLSDVVQDSDWQHSLSRNENSRTGIKGVSDTLLVPKAESISLSRESIHHFQCIGQVDRKYIACYLQQSTPAPQLLLLMDQHAVDERVQLEKMQAEEIVNDRRTILLSPPERIYVDWKTLQCLQEKASLLRSWCFAYHIVTQSESRLEMDAATTAPYAIDLLSVPMVCFDEVLTGEDLIEFCTHLQLRHEIPDSLQAPPAIQRILSSKACRAALKFGQVLQLREINSLLAQWQQTQLPFQCAHGRPSVVPIMHVSSLLEEVNKQESEYLRIDMSQLLRFQSA